MMFTQGDCMLAGRSKCRVGAHICIRNVQNPYDKHEVATKPSVTEQPILVEISLRIGAMVWSGQCDSRMSEGASSVAY